MDDLLEFLLGFIMDGAMDAVDSPRVPLWARIGLGALLSSVVGMAAKPSIGSIIVAVGFSMAIGVFFGYYPANKAAKLNPIDALRYE